jgi:type III pantothenate kinase
MADNSLNKILLIDIGNSSILCVEYLSDKDGCFENKISKRKKLKTSKFKTIFQYYNFEKYQKIIVSSVVPKLDRYLKKHKNVLFINYKTIPLIKVNLEKNEQVGADRVVNALAAWHIYKKSCLIIDSGTALTFCYIDKKGVYQGGSIFPGMKISSAALNLYTAKIPLIQVTPIDHLCGKTTKEAVQIGLYYGYISLINGLIENYKKMDPDIITIGTGNGINILQDKLNIDEINKDLILKGLSICAKEQK